MLRFAGFVVPIFVFLLYLVYTLFFSVNFPFQDDFLLIQFTEAIAPGGLGFFGMIRELFRSFNDHIAAIPRLIGLVEYSLTGNLNFRFYIVLIAINTTYIFYFLYSQFKKLNLPLYYFLPAPFLFFHPLYHEVSGWALNGMQHTFLTAFTVTAIILAGKRTNLSFAGALLCCFLATFTHGNGILSYPALVFYFIGVKDFKRVGITILAMFGSLAIYLIGYESGQAMNLPKSALVFFTSLFGFIGSSMSLWSFPELWSALTGIIIVGFVLFVTVKTAKIYFTKPLERIKPGTLELLSLFVFIFVTSLVIAIFRSWSGTTIVSRFQLYACLSIVIFYILLLSYVPYFRRRMMLYGVVGLSAFYWVYSYYVNTIYVANKKTAYVADVYNWKNERRMFSVPRQLLLNADFYLKPAYKKGVFLQSERVVSKNELISFFNSTPIEKKDYEVFISILDLSKKPPGTSDYERYFYVVSDIMPGPKRFLADRFLVLRHQENGRIYLKNADPKVQARKVILTKGEYFKGGFNVFFRPDDLDEGQYDLGVLDVEVGGKRTFSRVDRSLSVADENLLLN
ncbi:hypothetical protein [Dyadobacter sp. CY312]|uniref:hypothetical protein n=1 Tax=Dyadobacter sp. CY312 TaxID=2907303 RepID=UPI001F19D732|nr:hypothetical protein [Dyadobacter sp. CY312]MCE7040943.1 hypothetical protein [Dyadobacter sp. CY312]